jgi:hypothetical protein
MARYLKPYDIKPKLVKIAGNVSRGYYRADLFDAGRRYLPPLPQESVTSVTGVIGSENSGPVGDAGNGRGNASFDWDRKN